MGCVPSTCRLRCSPAAARGRDRRTLARPPRWPGSGTGQRDAAERLHTALRPGPGWW